jgi:dipeptide/tripeptide permease
MKMLSMSEGSKKQHWLDHSEAKFGPKLVKETKVLLNVLVMYLPLPIFWALLNQQSSRWVFQATRMNGDIGWYTIKPDQMIVLGPISITILIPLFNQFGFPLLARLGIKSPLQKMSLGMIVAGISFLVSAYVEMQIAQRDISILYLFPQYFLVSISEILLWVANVCFAYTQAPKSMKSVMTSSVYLSVAGGSLLVFFISGFRIFSSLVHEFLFYAGLMFIDTVIFGVLAKRFKYIDNEAAPDKEDKGSDSESA